MVNDLQLVHLPCIGHTFQLSVERGLQVTSIARVIGRCKKLAQQFHKSTQLTYDLREKQKLLSDGPSLELFNLLLLSGGLPTRCWNKFRSYSSHALCAVLLEKPWEI